jgi:hypothetical protein
MEVIRRWGDRQHLADRLDPIRPTVIVNERDHGLCRRSSFAWAKYADALRKIMAFFRSAKAVTGITPARVTTDGHDSYPRAIRHSLFRRSTRSRQDREKRADLYTFILACGARAVNGRWSRHTCCIPGVCKDRMRLESDEGLQMEHNPGSFRTKMLPRDTQGLQPISQYELGESSGTGVPTNCIPIMRDEIRGWGRYRIFADSLPLSEREKINRLADVVVTSFSKQGCIPLGQITVVGHADKDQRGPQFELRVSEERATTVSAALAKAIMALWRQRRMGKFARGAVAFSKRGVGATVPDRSNRPVVRDRTQNRRVEVTITPRGTAVPPPDTFEIRIRRLRALLRSRTVDPDPRGKRTPRARCVMEKVQNPTFNAVFVNGTASNERVGRFYVPGFLCDWPGNYDPPPLPFDDMKKFLGDLKAIIRGPGFAPGQSDEQILRLLSQTMFMISDGIVRVQRYITLQSAADTYTGDKTLNSLFSDHLDDPLSLYSCYKDFTGNE